MIFGSAGPAALDTCKLTPDTAAEGRVIRLFTVLFPPGAFFKKMLHSPAVSCNIPADQDFWADG